MSTPQAIFRVRTPQACERCRRSKTKCNGARPQCRSCSKRNVTCSWSQTAEPSTAYALTPPRGQDLPRKNVLGTSAQSPLVIPNIPSLVKLPLIPLESHLLERLFRIFFDRHHEAELCSFLHKPSLDIPTLYARSPMLVTSIISLAALYVPAHEAVADFGFETPSALSDHYAHHANSYASGVYNEPSIDTIQAYLILTIRELLTWSNIKAYMYAGSALRMAQVLYLGVEISQRYSPRQKEIRRRTFWACFIVDKLISYSCNRPFTVPFQLEHIQLPCPENVFAFDEVYTGFSVENLELQANNVSQLGVMPYFIAMLRLWGDMALLHVSGGRRRSKFGPHASEGEFYQYEKAIDDFSSSLPPSLTWSAQNYKLHQVTGQVKAYVNLTFLLHHSRCVMHQEYLPQLDSQYTLNSEVDYASNYDAAGISLDSQDKSIMHICMTSIHAITDMALMLNTGSDKDRELLQSIFAANAILTASAVHLWVLYTVTNDACPKHEALVMAEKLRQIIKSWQQQWPVATAWVETLEMLYKLYLYSYGKVVDSDLDCWDMETDDINGSSEAPEEAIDESSGHSTISDENGMPDPSSMCQRLCDKIRTILVNPLLATDVKKRNLRIYSRTLWQHMWIFGPIEGASNDLLTLETIMDEP